MMGNCSGIQKEEDKLVGCSNLSKGGLSQDASPSDSRGIKSSFMESSFGAAPSIGDYNSVAQSFTSKSLHEFSYSDLKAATCNFQPDSVLGEGLFGIVYKGLLDEHTLKPALLGSGSVVAVKVLDRKGMVGHQEWLKEVHYLGQMHHENLVKLIGFCAEDDRRLLVYEFAARGSLSNHLFGGGKQQTLSWETRMKVAIGVSKGLAYLHDAVQPVDYKDFSSFKVLLDTNFNAKLSGSGLAKYGPIGNISHVPTTRIIGNYTGADREFFPSEHLPRENNVYNFGVILLEIMSGRKEIDRNKSLQERNLVTWARPYLRDKQKVRKIFEPQLEGQYTMKEAQQVGAVAWSCVQLDPARRPQMKDVVAKLENSS